MGFGQTRRRERLAGAVAGGEGLIDDEGAAASATPGPLQLGPDRVEGRRAGARRRGRHRLHLPRHPGTAAAAREGLLRRVLQPRHVAGLDVVRERRRGCGRGRPTTRAVLHC